VLAGAPTYTLDAGAMAWPVTAHVLSDKATTPARAEWAEALAWSQWSETELETGEAWAHLAPLMEAL